MWFQWNGKSEQFLETVLPSPRIIPILAPQHRQYALTSDLLDLSNFAVREEAVLAMNWIKDRPEGLKLQNLFLTRNSHFVSPGESFDEVAVWTSLVCGLHRFPNLWVDAV